MIDETITELVPLVGVKSACAVVGRPRATHYRKHRQSPAPWGYPQIVDTSCLRGFVLG